ncbi:MAG: glycosyltransferase family 4 protein [Bacteroidales bacterium]|nr:glycosyltransferase family 4 protein [Bacteroidales bacterium]
MTKILVFIDWYLPGYKAGGPIRSVANFVEHFSSEFVFYIVTRNTDYLENKPYKNIDSNKWIKKSENVNVFYFSNKNLSVKNIKKTIQLINFDVVYINGIYSWYFSILPVILFKNEKTKKIIVASRGMLSNQAFSSKKLKKNTFLKIANFLKLYKNTIFQTTSESETIEIQYIIKSKKDVVFIPNLPPFIKTINFESKIKAKSDLKLVSIARISKEKNTLFALKILADYKYSGNISFDIYGSIYQKEYWAECEKIIADLPKNIVVKYKGELNNELVISTLKNYHFLFLPSKGENFGHSILESFIAGCPVIISDKTPWKNLSEKNIGWDISLKNTEKYYSAIQYCIDIKQDEYNKMSQNTIDFANEVLNNNELKNKTRTLFSK